MSQAIERIRVVMIRPDLEQLPTYPLPSGFTLRCFRPSDAAQDARSWAAVETAAGEFAEPAAAERRFREEFLPQPEELARRCLFLENADQQVIGTSCAWYKVDEQGECWGRLHWVGIVPAYQGQGLAKPLVAAALERLAQFHERAYLTTQTTSFKAVKIYLDFGFRPHIVQARCETGWRLLAQILRHSALQEFDSVR